MMNWSCARLFAAVLLGVVAPGAASFAADPATADNPAAVQLSDRDVVRWRVGLSIETPGNATGLVASMALPTDWPEQGVKLVAEDISPQVRKPIFRELDGVKQVVITIPRMAAGDEAHAIFTYEIQRRDIDTPEDPSGLVIPKKSAALMKYLGPSPYIETNDAALKQAAQEAVGADVTDPWKKAEAIYDYVRSKVSYKFDPQIQSAVSAWKSGQGDCEELTSLFIAFCRNQGIPARAVWVPGHCYPEFYLQDATGQGHWYPCQAAGQRDFGRMHEERPILQKGDNFRTPDSRTPQRYVQPTLKAQNAAVDPVFKMIMERVTDE